MRKLLTLATIFACMFAFSSCNDDDDKEPVEQQETTRYRLEVCFDDMKEPVVVEGIFIFGQEDYISVKDIYFSTEADISLSAYDYRVYTEYKNTKGIGNIQVVFRIANHYYLVNQKIEKNMDNEIKLHRNVAISEADYNKAKQDYEEHVR